MKIIPLIILSISLFAMPNEEYIVTTFDLNENSPNYQDTLTFNTSYCELFVLELHFDNYTTKDVIGGYYNVSGETIPSCEIVSQVEPFYFANITVQDNLFLITFNENRTESRPYDFFRFIYNGDYTSISITLIHGTIWEETSSTAVVIGDDTVIVSPFFADCVFNAILMLVVVRKNNNK